ncbi:hypothetical protein KUV95_12305 [Microbulbifer agarilyticus]|uniref:hypothetical protein n=1 Tax=Microbulbifer agarilyticus TaxID=260552 RepID=UPI001C95E329|nr:hypothetical protein [Microbulbifer agarilyticus]MBY6212334.1 hypothetical protein [Microbulbifer agarilyticus]
MFQRQRHHPILSVAAGVGIAYVFLVLLPKLAEIEVALGEGDSDASILPVALNAYLGALAGFVVFLLIANKGFFEDDRQAGTKLSLGELTAFCVFCVYCAQVGFLLGEWPSANILGYLALVCAFGLHFVGINFHLWRRYPVKYPKALRWLFAASLLLGWLASVTAEDIAGAVKFSTMFVAGGIIITAMREEIPAQRDVNILYFLGSVTLAAIFILVVEIYLLR